MKASDVIKSIMGKHSITQSDMVTMMNVKSQSAISGALNRDMKISTVIRFLTCMDCELVIRDKASGQEYSVTE